MVVDLGTGDGRAVLDRARSGPGSLVIGIDANAAAMADASRRASRSVSKGGVANAVFVVGSAERLAAELEGVADELTVNFPWGSLLRGVLALDGAAAAAAGIASLLAPDGTATAILSIEERDRLDLPSLDASGQPEELRERWRRYGLALCQLRPATATEIDATGSTWARRLRAGRERAAWRLELRRADGPAHDEPGNRR
ncbi:MAG: methyltransferase domain-containing protein [Chloroflexota bacterium]